MKTNMKKVSLMAAMSVSLMMLAACGGKTNQTETTAGTTAAETTAADTTAAGTQAAAGTENTAGKDGVDYASYPADFAAWKVSDMKNYLNAAGVTTNDTFINMDLSETDIAPMKATAGFLYADFQGGSVVDTVCYFDSSDADAKAMLDTIIENHAIVIDGNKDNGVAIDAVLGDFTFAYTLGTDEEHIAVFVQALKDLASHYNVEAAYINE